MKVILENILEIMRQFDIAHSHLRLDALNHGAQKLPSRSGSSPAVDDP